MQAFSRLWRRRARIRDELIPSNVGVARRSPVCAKTTDEGRRWRLLAYVYGAATALLLIVTIFRVPFPVGDTIEQLLVVQETPALELFQNTVSERGYLRPLRWMTAEALFAVSRGRHFLAYKSFHAAEIALIVILLVRLLRVSSRRELMLVPATLAALLGLHTFTGIINEVYPVNAKATVLVGMLAVINLSDSRPRPWKQVVALAVATYSIFLNELGLLVPVAIIGATLVGFKGLSRRTAWAATALVVAYLAVRFGPLAVGSPGLTERASGFGFSVREPDELLQLFGRSPLRFYIYNVVSSVMTVLFSEPRAGVFSSTVAAVTSSLRPWHVIALGSSLVTTATVVRFAHRRIDRWRQGELEHADRIVALSALVLVANAAISFPYTKNVVMGPAGALYAVAAFVAARDWLERALGSGSRGLRVGVLLVVGMTTLGWSTREVGLFYSLRTAAYTQRAEWLRVDEFLDEQGLTRDDPASRRLVRDLRRQFLTMPAPTPYRSQRWAEHWLDPR